MNALILPTVSALLFACSQPKDKPASEVGEPKQSASTAPIHQPTPASTTGGDLGYGDDARLFSSLSRAVTSILDSEPGRTTRVLGFGEFHKTNQSAPVRSALRQFASELFDTLGPRSAHLVLESWSVDPSCGTAGTNVTKQIQKAIERPKESESEMETLIRKLKGYSIQGHLLHFDCDEYASLLGDAGLDNDRLLTAVSKKLGAKTKEALAAAPEDKLVLVYGGATHNDLTPYRGLESWSYAKEIAALTRNRYIEIDLYVPEFIADDPLLSQEPWYPLLKEARKDQVILIRRSLHSYIILLRKDYAD